MSDEKLQALKRRWEQTKDVEDEANYLRAMIDSGSLSLEGVHIAALCNHRPALVIVPEFETRSKLRMREWLALFDNLSREQVFGCLLASSLPLFKIAVEQFDYEFDEYLTSFTGDSVEREVLKILGLYKGENLPNDHPGGNMFLQLTSLDQSVRLLIRPLSRVLARHTRSREQSLEYEIIDMAVSALSVISDVDLIDQYHEYCSVEDSIQDMIALESRENPDITVAELELGADILRISRSQAGLNVNDPRETISTSLRIEKENEVKGWISNYLISSALHRENPLVQLAKDCGLISQSS